jgi:nucleoside-diphosphate-sugar epimerase
MLARVIIQLTNSQSRIVYQPLPSDDPTNRKPDINRAKEVLKWEPKYDLDEGLQKTIDYFMTKKEE